MNGYCYGEKKDILPTASVSPRVLQIRKSEKVPKLISKCKFLGKYFGEKTEGFGAILLKMM